MRHRNLSFKIGRTQAHREALLSNAACSLIMSGRIRTTVTKAKQIRRRAEKMITLGKRGSLHDRRRAIAILHQVDVVGHLFREVAPRYEARQGGYTRIVRLVPRRGDAAEMCILELVGEAAAAATAAPAAVTEPQNKAGE